jgi:competence protein ComEA
MPTPAERNALVFLAAIGAVGLAARAWLAPPARPRADAASEAALDRQVAAVDSARRAAGNRARRGRGGMQPAESTAVRGRKARPAPVRQGDVAAGEPLARYDARREAVADANASARSRLEERTAISGPAWIGPPPGPGAARHPAAGQAGPVDLDVADAAAIAALPWIGEALAGRIVADRVARGPFGSLAGLQRVPGVGPGLAGRIGHLVTFSGRQDRGPEIVTFHRLRRGPARP